MAVSTTSSMAAYVVLAFVAAHFIAMFGWSNLGVIATVGGADALRAAGFTGIPVIISFVLFTALMNLFIGSGAAMWVMMSSVFVPMLMLLGYSPEAIQAAYRLGDAVTNIVSPCSRTSRW
jgi:aminobenzoyl-glutamate transport protein